MRNLQEKHVEALELLESVRDARIRNVGENHPETLYSRAHIADTYVRMERYEEAVQEYEYFAATIASEMGENHGDRLEALQGLAAAYAGLGNRARAEQLYRESVEGFTATLGSDDLITRRAQQALQQFVESHPRQ